jgi:HlyD family secretion protein
VLPDAYPDQPLDAVVERILPRVDPESGTVTVLLRLVRPTSTVTLMDGMAVDIALIRERHDEVIRVPAEAVKGQGDRAEVWVKSGQEFVRRQISAGATDGQWVEVKAGLTAGDVVRVN